MLCVMSPEVLHITYGYQFSVDGLRRDVNLLFKDGMHLCSSNMYLNGIYKPGEYN